MENCKSLKELTLEEKIGQMLCFAFHGTEYNEQLKTLIEKHHVGSIICFAHNISTIEQISTLNYKMQAQSKIPLFIGLDQEGGMVRRVINDIVYLPGAMALSAGKPEDISELNYETMKDLKSIGFNINFAPVGDVNNNPLNPVINSRSYSDNASIVSEYATNAALGMQQALILPTMKHFPGHGDTAVDSHLGLPIVDKTIEDIEKCELIPFMKAINQGVEGIMISHILYSQLDRNYPASLSYNIVTGLLKQKLGFKGLVITDSLTMSAIWGKYTIKEIVKNSINAGDDIIMFCGKADLEEQKLIIETFKELVINKEIPLSIIDEAVGKILQLKGKYCQKVLPNYTNLGSSKGQEISKKATFYSISKVFSNNLLPLRASDKVLIIFPKIRLASLVDNANNNYETLGKYLPYDEMIYDQELKNIENIVQNQKKYDKIIIATYNVNESDYQTKIYEELDKNKVIVIALRSPYDIKHLPNCHNYFCTYDCTKESLMALAQSLIANEYHGKLPIKLSL